MSSSKDISPAVNFAISSDLGDDVWHDDAGSNPFETWHFDALSDDGREAVAIKFHDNCPFSAGFFRRESLAEKVSVLRERSPAVSFAYAVDGKVVLRAINEFGAPDFATVTGQIGCSIGPCSFRVDTADYGSGFLVTLDMNTRRGRRIVAELEWLSIESNLGPSAGTTPSWNIVTPRSDVSGRITLIGRHGKEKKLIHFRGTGYHDHLRSDVSELVGKRGWGRAHFVDATVVFQFSYALGTANLIIIRDGKMVESPASCSVDRFGRNMYGFRLPRAIKIESEARSQLSVRPMGVIKTGFFEAKMVCETILKTGDGISHQALGLVEFTDKKRMKSPTLRLLDGLGVGRKGKPPIV